MTVVIHANAVIKTMPFATRQSDGRRQTSHFRKSEALYVHSDSAVMEILTSCREIRVIMKEHSQLTEGLQYMYLRSRAGQAWDGLPVKSDSKGRPLVHEILERMGVVDPQVDSVGAVTNGEQGSVSNESTDLDPPTPITTPPNQAVLPVGYAIPEPWKPDFSYDDTGYGFWTPCDSTLGWDSQGTNHVYLTPPMEQGYGFSNL